MKGDEKKVYMGLSTIKTFLTVLNYFFLCFLFLFFVNNEVNYDGMFIVGWV